MKSFLLLIPVLKYMTVDQYHLLILLFIMMFFNTIVGKTFRGEARVFGEEAASPQQAPSPNVVNVGSIMS